jgi:acetyl-CoA synthetase
MSSSATEIYRQARDLLLRHRADYERAVAEFTWPTFPDTFNWAIDWFDAYARGNDRTALWIVEEGGSEARYSFDTMASRSDQLADLLAADGVGPGDRVLLMLGNQVELWESVLAIMKLGAVIVPTTTALRPADLIDRIERGRMAYVIANAADAGKFADVPGKYGRLVVGGRVSGWTSFQDARSRVGTVRSSRNGSTGPWWTFASGGTIRSSSKRWPPSAAGQPWA